MRQRTCRVKSGKGQKARTGLAPTYVTRNTAEYEGLLVPTVAARVHITPEAAAPASLRLQRDKRSILRQRADADRTDSDRAAV